MPRLSLVYADQPVVPMPVIYEAGLCLIAQGSRSRCGRRQQRGLRRGALSGCLGRPSAALPHHGS
ncbi:AraC family transcriptional regulator N-terminal domain-containing protein [Rhizobium sp. AN64]|uniref:AraC family transcriptional regulator N-terminal domain-containing protein n=1 Tax=unclassified Rhizobium TaxID=2613769 RepID=UPI002B261063|nr:AraC family transcriptional regulator N-terminal domain-containing protein [Rhizobium sp. AN64]